MYNLSTKFSIPLILFFYCYKNSQTQCKSIANARSRIFLQPRILKRGMKLLNAGQISDIPLSWDT
jgi:hypothetical protein